MPGSDRCSSISVMWRFFAAWSSGQRFPRSWKLELFQAMQGKDIPGLAELTAALDEVSREALRLLPQLYGGIEALERRSGICPTIPEIGKALDDLRTSVFRCRVVPQIYASTWRSCADITIIAGWYSRPMHQAGQRVALGGRYDEVGKHSAAPGRRPVSVWICVPCLLRRADAAVAQGDSCALCSGPPRYRIKSTLCVYRAKWSWWICLGTK